MRLADTHDAVIEALARAFDVSDLVISTGRVSVGDYDFFTDAAQELNLQTVFLARETATGQAFALRQTG